MAALTEGFQHGIRTNCAARHVSRYPDGVEVTDEHGSIERFDQVVMATHSDVTLRLLSDATRNEQQLLRSFPYQSNDVVMHTDKSLLPRTQRAWASWNYRIPESTRQHVSVTYDLSRLQGLNSATPILLTLNDRSRIDPAKIIRSFEYDHPIFTTNSIQAQNRLSEINGANRTYFCGAYWGYGFHEDGVNSALEVARHFGKTIEECKVASIQDESRTAALAQ